MQCWRLSNSFRGVVNNILNGWNPRHSIKTSNRLWSSKMSAETKIHVPQTSQYTVSYTQYNSNYNNKYCIVQHREFGRNCQHRISQNTWHQARNVSTSILVGGPVKQSENAPNSDLPNHNSDLTTLNGSQDDRESELGGKSPGNDRKSTASLRKNIISRLRYLGQELHEVEQLLLADNEIESMIQAAREVYSEGEPAAFSQKVDVVEDLADQLAFNVIRIRQMFFRSEAEIEEKRRRLGNLLVTNVKECDAAEAEERHKHDVMVVRKQLNLLGVEFAKVQSIERLEYCGGHGNVPLVRIRFTRTFNTERQIFKAQKRVRNKMRIIPDRTPLQLECDKQLKAEMTIRNLISRLRRDPWDWIINQNKVVHIINFRKDKQSYDLETEALERLTDELSERRRKFKGWAKEDKQEIERRRKLKRCITIHNIEPCDSTDKETCAMHHMHQVHKIFSNLGFPLEVIEKVESVGLEESDADDSSVHVTLSSVNAKRKFMMQKGNLTFGRDKRIKGVGAWPMLTFMEKYIDVLKLHEVEVRNMILRRNNEKGKWWLRGGSIEFED